MITDEERSNLDNLSSSFLGKLEYTFPGLTYNLEFTDSLSITIPAMDQRVGDINITFDREEVTVRIGKLAHTHFETYLDDSLPKQDAEDQATSDAIDFVKDILDNLVIIERWYDGETLIQAALQYIDEDEPSRVIGVFLGKEIDQSRIRVEKLLWSGIECN